METKNLAKVVVELSEATGKVVGRFPFSEINSGVNSIIINTEGVSPGVYFMTVFLDGKILNTKKVVIIN